MSVCDLLRKRGRRNDSWESAIDFYEEDIDRFIRSPVTEPLTVPTHLTARRRHGIPWTQPAEPNTSIWPGLVNRPGLDLYTGPCAKPAETQHRSDGLVPSTLRGVRTRGGCVRGRCDKRRTSAILPRGVLESVDIGLSRATFVPLTLSSRP